VPVCALPPAVVRRGLLTFLLAGGFLLLGAVFADQARAAGAEGQGDASDPLASVVAEAGALVTAVTAATAAEEEEPAGAGEPEVAGHLESLVSGLTETIGLSGQAGRAPEGDTVPGEGLEEFVPVPAPPQREPDPAPDAPDAPPGPEPRPEPRPGPADPGPVSHPGETGTAGGAASPSPQRTSSDEAGEPREGAPLPHNPGSRCAVQLGGDQTPRPPDSYAMSEARQPLLTPPCGDRRLRDAATALRGRPQDSAELPG
jgi:hypothetical protein